MALTICQALYEEALRRQMQRAELEKLQQDDEVLGFPAITRQV